MSSMCTCVQNVVGQADTSRGVLAAGPRARAHRRRDGQRLRTGVPGHRAPPAGPGRRRQRPARLHLHRLQPA